MSIEIRPYRGEDLEILRVLTVAAFDGVTLEQNVEHALGILAGHDWRWRKARHIDDDTTIFPSGIFVAEHDGMVIGYISTRIDRESGKGRIPNLVVSADFRGHGVGRRLIEHALQYFRGVGLEWAAIETMEQNEVGNHLYRSCGFEEVARQIHFARRL